MECNKIIFSNEDFKFEVSNNYVRKNIIDSIKSNIAIKHEIISELNNNIIKEQTQVNNLLENSTPELKTTYSFKTKLQIQRLLIKLSQISRKI